MRSESSGKVREAARRVQRIGRLADAAATESSVWDRRANWSTTRRWPPRGSIYLSARFGLNGMTAPGGERLVTNDDVRRYLLRSCGLAAVQFQAFGARDETGWFRLSAGAVTPDDIRSLLPRLREALVAVK